MTRYTPKIRLYTDDALGANASCTLGADQSHYLTRVMRQRVGGSVLLFNGRDGEWRAEIAATQKKTVDLLVLEQTRPQIAEPDLWLAFAPVKKARIDFIAQKATELGVAKLCPMVTEYTAMDRVNTNRLRANAIEAAEQCERVCVPTVEEPMRFDDMLANWPEERAIIFCDESLSGLPMRESLASMPSGTPTAIFIGPEGGFSTSERDALKARDNVYSVTLGPRILRADTAAIAAIGLWQAQIGDWTV